MLSSYARLTKARLSSLVLLTTLVGFVHGFSSGGSAWAGSAWGGSAWAGSAWGGSAWGGSAWLALLGTLLGTALTAGAANALNQLLEIRRDGLMHRTRSRPLPAGEISPIQALLVSLALAAVGVAVLALLANALAAALALGTLLVYVLLYTPLKTRSTLNTLVGAVCGAIPPMIGWVGAAGRLEAGAWVLGAILFVWQIPHFLALAWLYREDYARGRFAMLPVFDPAGRLTARIVVVTSLMLLPLALTATLLGLGGWIYAVGSLAAGLWLFAHAVRLHHARTNASARRVFLASLAYLTAVLVLLLVDRGPLRPQTPVRQLATASPVAAVVEP